MRRPQFLGDREDLSMPKAATAKASTSATAVVDEESTNQAQALALIDGKLGEIGMRELVSRTEFTNLLLDLRLLLSSNGEKVSVN